MQRTSFGCAYEGMSVYSVCAYEGISVFTQICACADVCTH
jgi:hypothetical protein